MNLFRIERTDPEDLEIVVEWIFTVCLWLFVLGASIIVIVAILKAGSGSLPPEPQWWIVFRALLMGVE